LDRDLKLLIENYRNEAQRIETLLQESLRECDYKRANIFLKALSLAKQKLGIFRHYSDTSYYERATLEDHIKNFRKREHDHGIPEIYKKALRESVGKDILKLEMLSQQPIIPVEDKFDIENAPIQLSEKEIKGIKLHLENQVNFYLEFQLKGIDIIEITIPSNLKRYYENFLSGEVISALILIGFIYSNDRNFLYYCFNLEVHTIAELRIFLSRLIFDTLSVSGFDNNTTMEIY
jgi:hypothetical protein